MVSPDKTSIERGTSLNGGPVEATGPLELRGSLVAAEVAEVNGSTDTATEEKDKVHKIVDALELLGSKMQHMMIERKADDFRNFLVIGLGTLSGTIGGMWLYDNPLLLPAFLQGVWIWAQEIIIPLF